MSVTELILLAIASFVGHVGAYLAGSWHGFSKGWQKGYDSANPHLKECQRLEETLKLMSQELRARLAVVHPDEWNTEEDETE